MAVTKTNLKQAAPAAASGTCKWCEQGACWTHGQIEKPKGFGKGKGKGKGKGFGKDKGQSGGILGQLLQLVLGGGESWGGGGKSWGKGKGTPRQQGYSTKKFVVDKEGGELGEFTGTIKSFGEGKNYGFIECEEAGQGDIFLHGDQKKGFRQGMTVKFECVLNKDGKANAINLKSMTSFTHAIGKFKVDKSGGDLGEFTGTIKSFGEGKNYGFIECAEAGQGDVFLHGDEKKRSGLAIKQGMTVQFECVLNKDGKANAINLKAGGLK